jgi:hypothetical protein
LLNAPKACGVLVNYALFHRMHSEPHDIEATTATATAAYLMKSLHINCAPPQVETDDGKLVVEVMREDLLPRCADLLADTFVDTKGIQAYR